LYSPESGIRIFLASQIVVINNTCNYNVFAGIEILLSEDVQLINNTCNYNYWGIGFSSCFSSQVSLNKISYNEGYGLVLSESSDNFITKNYFKSNPTGIFLSASDLCLITYNGIVKSNSYGVFLEEVSDFNKIYSNDFIQNNLAGYSQGFDEGEHNMWYNSETEIGNFWSNWEGYDSYFIDGDSYSVDMYPLGEKSTPPGISEFVKRTPFLLITSLGLIMVLGCKKKRERNP
jgi:parallel beta-helix repeat protein